MTSFKFPPPPPPPPKATPNNAQEQFPSQSGGYNNSRGGRGRGWQGRGRGNDSRGGSRGGHGNARGRGGSQYNSGPRGGGAQRGGHGGYQNHNDQQMKPPQASPQQTNPSPTSRNLIPGQQPQYGAQVQSSADPSAFAHAISFISTPSGMQAMDAFASHMASGGQNSYIPPVAQQQPPQQYSPPQGNKKRKRNDQGSESRVQQGSQSQSKPKPPRAKAAPAPAVPSFGFSLPTAPAPKHNMPPPHLSNRKNDKGGGNPKVHLGLTQREEQDYESSEEEDVDEEATFASTGKIEGMVFEHDGQTISLQTPTELAAWIKDRRKQYPTQKRVAQRAQETAERRECELEFLRKVKGKGPLKELQKSSMKKHKDSELQALRQKVQESVVSRRRLSSASEAKSTDPASPMTKPSAVELGLGYSSDSESEVSSILSESSVVSSSDEESEADSDDSNEAPEQESSKNAPKPLNIPRPAQVPALPDKPRICFQWQKYGKCHLGRRCRYPHPPKEEPKPIGLFERLVEQEKGQADKLTLDAIKWLGQNGFLG